MTYKPLNTLLVQRFILLCLWRPRESPLFYATSSPRLFRFCWFRQLNRNERDGERKWRTEEMTFERATNIKVNMKINLFIQLKIRRDGKTYRIVVISVIKRLYNPLGGTRYSGH